MKSPTRSEWISHCLQRTGIVVRLVNCSIAISFFSTFVFEAHARAPSPSPAPSNMESSCSKDAPSDVSKIVLEGGEVANNLFDHVLSLARSAALLTMPYDVKKGDSVCSILSAQLQVPAKIKCPETRAVDLFNLINNRTSKRSSLSVGERIQVPVAAQSCTKPYWRKYDVENPNDSVLFAADKKRWNATNRVVQDNGQAKIYFDAFEFRIPVDASRADPGASIIVPDDKSINKYVNPQRLPLSPLRFSLDEDAQLRDCSVGKEMRYIDLLREAAGWQIDRLPEDFHSCVKTAESCQGVDCARIILIDQPVLPHAKLRHALEESNGTSFPVTNGASDAGQCSTVKFQPEHHGTHLAGIMVSAKGTKGLTGLSPGVRFIPRINSGLPDQALGDLIQDQENVESPTPNVFVFASQFSDYEPADLNNLQQLTNPARRFGVHMASKRIQDNRPLWITAAGQQAVTVAGSEIAPNSPHAPMNLGDLENVVVVTACENCSKANASLIKEAMYGKIVAVAAPGRNILGLANQSSLAFAGGTSQATAFVAGVAAAMKSCYPRVYEPKRVKQRLMLTSRPSFGLEDYDKVRGGIVDPVLALIDPRKHWLKRVGGKLEPVGLAGWCSPGAIQLGEFFRDVNTDTQTFELSGVRRITRYADAAIPMFVLFRTRGDEVSKTQPGRPKLGREQVAVAKLTDGSTLKLSDVEELLLSSTGSQVPVIDCPAGR